MPDSPTSSPFLTASTESLARRLHRRVVVTGNPMRVGLTDGDRAAVCTPWVRPDVAGRLRHRRCARRQPDQSAHRRAASQHSRSGADRPPDRSRSAPTRRRNLAQLREYASRSRSPSLPRRRVRAATSCPMSTPPPIWSSAEPAREQSPSWPTSAYPQSSSRCRALAEMSRP